MFSGFLFLAQIIQCLKKVLLPTLCNIQVDWQLPDLFQVRRSSREIPFASHGQRLNIFASVSAPPGNWQPFGSTFQEAHSTTNGIKEFWFDEDFDSCQLGDNVPFSEDLSDDGEFPRDWDLENDTDIRCQWSDFKPLAKESEECFSGTSADRDEEGSERRENDGIEYQDHVGNAKTDRDADNDIDNNHCVISSFTKDIHSNSRGSINVYSSTTAHSSTNTCPESNTNTSTSNHYSTKYSNIDNGQFYDSHTTLSTGINSNSYTLSSASTLLDTKSIIGSDTSDFSIPLLDYNSADQQHLTKNDRTPLASSTEKYVPQDLVLHPNSLSQKTSRPRLTHLDHLPSISSQNLICCENSFGNQTAKKYESLLYKNHSCLSYGGSRKPCENNDPPRRSFVTEGNPVFSQSGNNYYPCERGIVTLTGFLGPEVYRKRIPFRLKPRLSTKHRNDLHQMAAFSFIESMEAMLDNTQSDDVIKKEVVELSKSSGVPSRFTSQVAVDEQDKMIGATHHALYSTITR